MHVKPLDVIALVRGIKEPQQRQALLLASLHAHASDWPPHVADVLAAATQGAHDARVLVHDLMRALGSRDLAEPARKQFHAAAHAAQLPHLAPLCLARPQRSTDSEARPIMPKGRALTLGERKSLARTTKRDVLLAVAKDPHPDVVRRVLENPQLTEVDVVRLAAARPGHAESLALIAEHPVWSVRVPIKRAVILNPATDPLVALRLLPTLPLRDLASLARDPMLDTRLRDTATKLYHRVYQP